ncbi:hypothetical protein MPTK1_3g15870 [Marchantia polymorpha subsp. ruderalis]|uniref:Attractin/MKLN-like beta-propeller domain-containing protein n=2 Tax=Marchantia polymorpha TaxID=3197 RepID=A0AAF6B195_MARPO|nr:hypothetical protein MARPO_0004s0085 [Marchantia polymorpha]BBN05779.1 hypothetical protein Mp_3g15870 [Marchantia polymorpha subsp. ruderalis]|eukprot:PTQ48800.1 hypothetical protein MARPO_0004s0085 [Marchantia polymorpha]
MRHLPPCPWVSLPGHRGFKGRAGHTATLVNSKVYVLGGRNGNEFYNDFWQYDIELSKWTLLHKHTPFEPRAYHTATLMSGNQIWVIGGSDHSIMYGDVHVFNTETLEWSSPETRGHLAGKLRGTHAALPHPVHPKAILVYGGYGGDQWLGDMSILRTDSLVWEELKCKDGLAPSGRGYHTFTAFGDHIVLFGGKGEGGIVSSDEISVYDAAVNVWTTPRVKGVPPLPRSNHAAALVDDNAIVIHGGRNGGQRLDDICLLKPGCVDSFEWEVIGQDKEKVPKKSKATKALGPGGRSAHTIVAKDESLYLIGGYGGGGLTFSDIYVNHQFIQQAGSRPRVNKKAARRSLDSVPDSPEDEGWRRTKQPRRASHPIANGAHSVPIHILESDDISTPDTSCDRPGVTGVALEDYHRQKRTVNVARPHVQSNVGADQMARAEALGNLQGRTEAITAHENELHRKELASMQQVVDSLRAELHGKNLLESELRSGKAALEQNILLLRKQIEEGNRTIMEQQSKMEKLKSDAQDLVFQLDDKKKEVFEVTHKLKISELKVDDLSRSLQQMTNSCSTTTQELNICQQRVEQLQIDVERKIQEVQQLNKSHESERVALKKEIAERRSLVERLTNELEVAQTSSRALQDTVDRLVKRAERDSSKIDDLQKEQGELKNDITVLTSERDQLIAKKDGAEASAELVREELRVARNLVERNVVEIDRLKDNADQAKEHIGCLHVSVKKNEEELKALAEENSKLRSLLKEIEDFETNQARNLQKHAEKLRCARQFGPS